MNKRIIVILCMMILLVLPLSLAVELKPQNLGDSLVKSLNPLDNFGTQVNFWTIDAVADHYFYIQFDMTEVSTQCTQIDIANLSIKADGATAGAINIHEVNTTAVGGNWNETFLTYTNSPCGNSVGGIADEGVCNGTRAYLLNLQNQDNRWYNVSVISIVKAALGRGANNVSFFGWSPASEELNAFHSREATAADRPVLHITCSGGPPPTLTPTVTILYPSNGDKLNNQTTYPLKINGTVTISDGSVANATWINSTNWNNTANQTGFTFEMNGTIPENEELHYMIFSNSTDGTTRNTTVYFTYDTISPAAASSLDDNNSFFHGYSNMTFEINMTDNIQLYYFNITTPEGYLYNKSGVNTTKYIYNGSINISTYSVGRHNITAEFCDAHTKDKIKDWDKKVDKSKMEIRFDFGDDYFSIIPLDKSLIEDISIEKQTDRYTFKYTKDKNNKKKKQSFIVMSSQKIDILGNQNDYYAHLVIFKLKKWIDFNTIFGNDLEYTITRINSNMVLVDIDNIISDEFTFNSAGTLNCGKKTWDYYVYNYTAIYTEPVIATNETDVKLVIDFKDMILGGGGILVYNSTTYSTVVTNSSQQVNLTATLVPHQYEEAQTIVGFIFNFTLNGSFVSTQNYSSTINSISLAYRGNYTNASVYNFTLYDENNNSKINGDISGTFNYLVGATELTFQPDLTNTGELSIEITPADATVNGDFIVYYSGTGYPERRYTETTAFYSNNTLLIDLYLIQSSTYFTVLIVDGYNNPITGVIGDMKRSIGGSMVTIEKQESDGAGLMSFLIDPSSDYSFTFTKAGYTTFSTTIRPISTEVYTVTLESETATIDIPQTTGILYYFTPSNTALINNTAYDFTFNLTSDVGDITNCTLFIKNASETLSSSSTSFTTTGCDITINLNTGNQTQLTAQAIYVIDGNTEYAQVRYSVLYTYEGTFSLKNFLDDIQNFEGGGFNDFSRALIAFIIIFAIVGFTTLKVSQFREPEPILILTWALILFFSYINWLPLPLDYPTVAGFGVEKMEQYMIFILSSLGVGAYILRRNL